MEPTPFIPSACCLDQAPESTPAAWSEWLERGLLHARGALKAHFGLPADGLDALPGMQACEFDKVNVTIRNRGRVRASMSGRGDELLSAIGSAVERCTRDLRFGPPLDAAEIPECVVELWIQIGSRPLHPCRLAEMILGVDGVEIRSDGRYAYYKPSVPLTSDLTTHDALLQKLCFKAGLAAGAWKQDGAELRATEWVHAVEASAGRFHILRRLRDPAEPSLEENSVAEAARRAAGRLVSGQDADGHFLYRYDPLKDRAESGSFSSVRHAGCAYALAWMGAFAPGDEGAEFSWSAAQALRGLLLRARTHPEDAQALYIPELHNRHGRLGTSALVLLALQFAPLTELFAEQRRGLAKTLIGLQDQAGWFRSSIVRGAGDESNQDYYPGEALTALGRELTATRSSRILAVFERAFPYYREHFRRTPNTAFILWQADAWRLFDECTAAPGDPSAAAEFVFEMVDWLLDLQYTPRNAPCPEYAGGFPRPATPRYSSACYVEAVIRACGLALRHGLAARARRYRTAARAGLRFVRRLQVGPESAFLFPRPEYSVGGISANLSTFAMRSDFDQHAITAFLAAIEVSRQWPSHAILEGRPR